MEPDKRFRNLNRGKIALGAITFWLLSFLWISFAHAHRVTIFAWVEGDIVHTESKFSGGKKVKHSPVEVYDNLGNKILEGKTDGDGKFSFKVPKKTAMKMPAKMLRIKMPKKEPRITMRTRKIKIRNQDLSLFLLTSSKLIRIRT